MAEKIENTTGALSDSRKVQKTMYTIYKANPGISSKKTIVLFSKHKKNAYKNKHSHVFSTETICLFGNAFEWRNHLCVGVHGGKYYKYN